MWVVLGALGLFYIGGALLNGLVRGVMLLPRAIVWWLTAMEQGADFWAIAGRAGGVVARALATSQLTWWIVGFEIVGVAALYGLRWLMRNEENKK